MKDEHLHQSSDNRFIPMTSFNSGDGREVRYDVYYFTNQIVNVIMVGTENTPWVLIDAGMPHSSKEIISHAQMRFGNQPPQAILLTHGHFDHVGSIVDILKEWDVPVYAHPSEFPYLTGKQAYPEPDTSVEGGILGKISSYYPHEPVDITPAILPLPDDYSVPGLTGWKWIHTPGHSPGHVSFYRASDGVLVAGDAFVTVRADSFYKVLVQKAEVNGPPRYLTTDWAAAEDSVRLLYDLKPQAVITGHGPAMNGSDLGAGLANLVDNFHELAVPAHGRFV